MTPGAKVPVQFIGQARHLRTRVEAAWHDAVPKIEQLLQPFQRRAAFKPVPRHDHLKRLARDWTTKLPSFGRLKLSRKFDNGELFLGEVRCIPKTIIDDDWAEEELAIALMIIKISMRPPGDLEQKYIVPAVIGQHALARRYQRCPARDDAAVFTDLLSILYHSQSDERGVSCPVATGCWVGERESSGEFLVRSFMDN